MVAQRLIAILLTVLLVALVFAVVVTVFSAAHHATLGWIFAAILCVLMGIGGWYGTRDARR